MTGEPTITMVGYLTADPKLRFTAAGAPVASFTVASTPRTFDRQAGEWVDCGSALFLDCTVWRRQAENVAESLAKGMRVIVAGKLRARSYDDRDGARRTVIEVDVDDVGPSLARAACQVTRAGRGPAGGGAAPGPAVSDPWAGAGQDAQPPF